jgi:IclR family pca regulon transcriptional regulator
MTLAENRYHVETLSRGLRILEAFTEDTPTLSLVEIASAVSLDKSTVFRFVYTLEKHDYLERDPQTKRYRPGLKVLRLGFTALHSMEIVPLAQPYLKSLFNEAGETTCMAVRDGCEIVYVARSSPRQILGANLTIGSHLPIHCTSMGKAHLLFYSDDQLRELLGEGSYEALTDRTITSLDALAADLRAARERGYTVSDEELAVGLRSVAAPILATDGQPIAAVNVSASGARISQAEMERDLAPLVINTARRISSALGAK